MDASQLVSEWKLILEKSNHRRSYQGNLLLSHEYQKPTKNVDHYSQWWFVFIHYGSLRLMFLPSSGVLRYILVSLPSTKILRPYDATSHKKPWISDSTPLEFEGYDSMDALLNDDGNGPIFTNKTSFRWLSAMDGCKWAGMVCDAFDQIRSITLSRFCS